MSKLCSVAVLLGSLTLAACVDAPPPRAYYRHPRPMPVAPRFQEVIAYPARGQSPEQLDRDKYECHRWATQQTGFDPALPVSPPPSGPPAQAPIPGSGLTVGAITGAVLGVDHRAARQRGRWRHCRRNRWRSRRRSYGECRACNGRAGSSVGSVGCRRQSWRSRGSIPSRVNRLSRGSRLLGEVRAA